MPAGRDDEALTWDGDDDPTLDIGADSDPHPDVVDPTAPSETAVLPAGYTAVGRGSEALAAPDDSGAGARSATEPDAAPPVSREPMGNTELIAVGVIGGSSVLFAVGWLIGGLRLQGTAEFLVAPLAYQVSLWLAVVAPIVWFGSVMVLTAASKKWVRFLWLIGGVLVLIPWPFIMVGAIGQ
ncbi:DNA polymerase III subunit gamma/tau [Microbacterium sp.]|uniref:DNA polymerase III subunit gamma/tau n=1 Tax=Microbacterium sp. TaxID=51671 RepID=UPI0035B41EFC